MRWLNSAETLFEKRKERVEYMVNGISLSRNLKKYKDHFLFIFFLQLEWETYPR